MKNKKLWFLLVAIFLFTGCSGGYQVEIYKNKVTEQTSILYKTDELNDIDPYDRTLSIANEYDNNADFLINDSRKNITKNGQKGIKLIRNYTTIDDYKESSLILGSCYVATSLTNYSDYITLRTSNEFTCYDMVEEFDDIEISVKTNHKVVENNADKKKGNTYYWYLTRENYQNKPISIKLYKDKYVWNYDNEVFKRLGLIILVVSGTLLVVSGVYKFYQKKQKNVNDI